ncbi:MAG: aldehyde dehydrogenase family protein, partial [Candidatus Heimdallarchaeota archaeon]|nr:aldehyde dehydrogenase family protein [Candidatus Heimdallarchaeota archaeon]
MKVSEIYEDKSYGPAPEGREMAMQWLAEKNNTLNLYINGDWVIPEKEKYFNSINPANKEILAKIAEAGKSDVNQAVASAKKAHSKWMQLGAHGRARYLYAIARQVQKHSRLFAVLETLDNGKPIRESRDIDIPLVARHFYYHAGIAQLMDKEFDGYESLGVVGQIIPWNFPLLMLAWKVAPALATGNTVVLKPAEFTSITAILFAEICQNVGLPPGVVNIVTGFGKTGEFITSHKDISKIAFTGSTEVGKIIRRVTAGSGKKLSLELGGKSPFIVFEDADLDSAVEGVVDSIWFNQGQVCCAGSRLLIQENIADKFLKKLKEKMEKLRMGDPLDKAIDMGAVIDKVQFDKVDELVNSGENDGAIKWQPSWSCPDTGYFYPPTLFTSVTPSARIAQEEIFGPVLVSLTFRTHAEAVNLANNTIYGLAASIWTENINLALDIAPQIKAGSIWINSTNLFDAASGFGGYRESGFGREGGYEGVFEYIKPKYYKEFKSSPFETKSNTETTKTGIQSDSLPPIDKTAKLYIGGKQTRPDSGYSLSLMDTADNKIGEVGLGNRKDIRNAVEAAHKNTKWSKATAHNRAQVLYYLAENLSYREDEFAQRIME